MVAAPLLAIVYSEFDNTLGPTIRCQAPEGFLSQELFDSISDYVITGRQLYGRTVSVTASDLLVVGFPLCIENDKVRAICGVWVRQAFLILPHFTHYYYYYSMPVTRSSST